MTRPSCEPEANAGPARAAHPIGSANGYRDLPLTWRVLCVRNWHTAYFGDNKILISDDRFPPAQFVFRKLCDERGKGQAAQADWLFLTSKVPAPEKLEKRYRHRSGLPRG
jgi:hypothetical protein